MGAGKSTVGRELAERLGYTFLDSDTEIEQRTGVSIPWIFDIEGEAGFRRRETAMLDELTRHDEIVLATGGGAVTVAANRDLLGARGLVVYLHTPVKVQLRRTRNDTNRPLLQGSNPQAKLEALMAEREPLYRELADVVVESTSGRARSVAQRIEQALAEHSALPAPPPDPHRRSTDP